ncbi:hypothetical protein H2201_008223 [Coniosporium apollinis]|uniref:DUF3074 domain-containing protein n=1 Tax=Coniosporium apollinis TaxID=61459 RepID=A0ABQ9NK31_9PEZI|nr:hypothetical protein H2201_008223 [Coniosporium apollinis]
MSALHDALKVLRPKDFSEVPQDDLGVFLRDIFAQAELIVNSVPPPPGGSDFASSKRSRSDSNGAKRASEITSSPARPPPLDPSHEDLQKSWGKPLKLGPKENPLGISVYKMAGHDRHGAWFARRSVHEGLGFAKWKKAMRREFAESLAVQGGPGAGSIRGIGSDQRLERKDVEGIGRMEVYQLSAQFPGPTAPREFITLLLTSDGALSDKSAIKQSIPRHYMVVSIPVTHPDAPPRNGYVRGEYESVEMIREIPLTPHKPDAKTREANIERKENAADDDSETNPVEWIMVTRSDPGGGIPRFMVDRGTPGSIAGDAVKFLDWACGKEEIPDEDADAGAQEAAQELKKQQDSTDAAQVNGHPAGIQDESPTKAYESAPPTQGGLLASALPALSSVTNAVESGIAAYAPAAVQNYLPETLQPKNDGADDDVSSDTSSIDSFTSVEEFRTAEDNISTPRASRIGDSTDSLTSMNSITPSAIDSPTSARTHHDKELEKIEKKKAQLDEKLQKSRQKEIGDSEKARQKYEAQVRKAQEKHAREMAKLEARRQKEAARLAARKQKEDQKNALTKTQRERDEWKMKAEVLAQENKVLHEQVRELQRENTALVAKMGKLGQGPEVIRQIREELAGGRSRASSGASNRPSPSVRSKRSAELVGGQT